MAPEWSLFALASLFLAGSLFYTYRLVRASQVRSVYGYFDWENEVGHGLCMLGMVTMLSPSLLPIPAVVWAGTFGLAFLWFLARALTWGKRVSYPTRWWWDWAHVAMLGGMGLMYANVTTVWLNAPLAVFWLWLGGYYLYELKQDLPSGKLLYIGSDLAHSLMGFVMLLMTLFPSTFMPMHGHHGMHGHNSSEICSPHDESGRQEKPGMHQHGGHDKTPGMHRHDGSEQTPVHEKHDHGKH